jgi:mRNA interferase MazF
MVAPEKGDIVWMDFDPTLGHEQRGRRPAIVLTPFKYNNNSNLALFCPITSNIKNYPFEVKIKNTNISGVILVDQIKSFDWTKKNIEIISKLSQKSLEEVIQKVSLLIKG